jgi:hypothetical protein
LDDHAKSILGKNDEQIRKLMLRAIVDLRNLATEQSDPAKATEMRRVADHLDALACEE